MTEDDVYHLRRSARALSCSGIINKEEYEKILMKMAEKASAAGIAFSAPEPLNCIDYAEGYKKMKENKANLKNLK